MGNLQRDMGSYEKGMILLTRRYTGYAIASKYCSYEAVIGRKEQLSARTRSNFDDFRWSVNLESFTREYRNMLATLFTENQTIRNQIQH
jgi:hypothetical protein